MSIFEGKRRLKVSGIMIIILNYTGRVNGDLAIDDHFWEATMVVICASNSG